MDLPPVYPFYFEKVHLKILEKTKEMHHDVMYDIYNKYQPLKQESLILVES